MHGDPTINKRPNRPGGPCRVPGCERPSRSRGLCEAHYKKQWRYGDALHEQSKVERLCSVEGCGKPHYGKGFCRRHLRLLQAHGSVDYQRPVKNGAARRPKLSADDIRLIRENGDRLSAEQLAERFHTSLHTISAVKAGRNWGWRLP